MEKISKFLGGPNLYQANVFLKIYFKTENERNETDFPSFLAPRDPQTPSSDLLFHLFLKCYLGNDG